MEHSKHMDVQREKEKHMMATKAMRETMTKSDKEMHGEGGMEYDSKTGTMKKRGK